MRTRVYLLFAASLVLAYASLPTTASPLRARYYTTKRDLRTQRLKPRQRVGLAGNPNVKTYQPKDSTDTLPVLPVAPNRTFALVDPVDQSMRKRATFSSSLHVVPLKPLRKRNSREFDGLHPVMYFQQHLNRAMSRMAQFTGQQLVPEILEEHLRKRWQSLHLSPDEFKLRRRDNLRYRGQAADGAGRRGDAKYPTSSFASDQLTPGPTTVTSVVFKTITADNIEEGSETTAIPSVSGSGSTQTQIPKSIGMLKPPVQAAPFRAGFERRRNVDDKYSLHPRQDNGGTVDDDMIPDNTNGFSEVELDALLSNAETVGPNDVGNVLGLDIQSNDVGYYTDIEIGTPPVRFKMLVDSGSADTWVPSQACRTCGNHQILGSRTSSSFRVSNQPFQVTYGSGDVSGAIIQDVMRVGNLTLAAHVFGVTTNESPEFGSDNTLFDGLMGTAQSILSNQRVLTPVEALGKAGAVASSAMGYALGRVADGENDGTVTFGGINLAQIDGKLVEVPNVSRVGFWEGAMNNVTVDGQSLNLQGRSAILDTGTTLLIVPEADAQALHALIPGSRSDGQGGFIIPCDTQASVALTFAGMSFTIDPRDLAFVPLDANDLAGECQSGISSGTIGADTQWLVGDVFLKSVYFATDVESNTIGLGKRRQTSTGMSGAPMVAVAELRASGVRKQLPQSLLAVTAMVWCALMTVS